MSLRIGSFCSGIAAPEVAWTALGWQPQFFSEIDPFACAVEAHHFPHVPNLGDMEQITDEQIGKWAGLSLVVAGTPCQSFSVAGLRGGMADPRGNLALVLLRLVDRLRPRWLVWENVPGILSSNDGRDFGAFLGALGQLRYGWAYRILDAQFFGVPQRRRRVFVVGHLGDWRRAAAVLFERYCLSGNPPPSREAGQRVAASLTRGADSSGAGGYAGRRREDDSNIVVNCLDRHMGSGGPDDNAAQAGHLIASTGETSHCLNAGGMGRQDYETETLIAHSLRADGFDASEDETGRGTPIVPVAYRDDRGRGNDRALSDGTTYPLHAAKGQSEQQVVAFAQNTRDEIRLIGGDGQLVGALAAEPGMKQQNYIAAPIQYAEQLGREKRQNGMGVGDESDPCYTLERRQVHGVITPMAVRRLTPRECERLQGFHDNYTAVTYRGKPAADGPRYRALGNSMAVPVLRWIGERIALVEAT